MTNFTNTKVSEILKSECFLQFVSYFKSIGYFKYLEYIVISKKKNNTIYNIKLGTSIRSHLNQI